MIKIGIVDDGIGFLPTVTKLRQALNVNYLCLLWGKSFAEMRPAALFKCGQQAVDMLAANGCDVVVFSSAALSARCAKPLSAKGNIAIFGCDAPIMHAVTYSASNVLVVGDKAVTQSIRHPNAIGLAMPQFHSLAEQGNERRIVDYIDQTLSPHSGKFDCIALASSSMNMYKSCFYRVFPNVQIFDSLEGVARRLRKKYKNNSRDEGTIVVIDQNNDEITQKFGIFLQ